MLLQIFSLSFSLMLAVILLVAASHKLRVPQQFARQLEAYELLPQALVVPVARALPIVEGAIALAFLVPFLRHFAGIAAAALLLLYAVAISLNLWRGRRDIDCGCGGPGLERPLEASLVVRNAVLVAMAVVTAVAFEPLAVGAAGILLVVAFTLCGLLLYAASEGLLVSRRLLQRPSGESS